MRTCILFVILLMACAPPCAAATTPASPKPGLVTVPKPTAEGLLGEAVVDTAGAKVGTVVNVLVDQFGKPQAAVIQFAGFLGVGNREVALAWNALRFSLHGNDIVITVTVDANTVKALPQYAADAPTVPLATPAHTQPVVTAGKTAP